MTATDKVQELCGLVTSSLWPQLSSTLASSSKFQSDQSYFSYSKELCFTALLELLDILFPCLKYALVLVT